MAVCVCVGGCCIVGRGPRRNSPWPLQLSVLVMYACVCVCESRMAIGSGCVRKCVHWGLPNHQRNTTLCVAPYSTTSPCDRTCGCGGREKAHLQFVSVRVQPHPHGTPYPQRVHTSTAACCLLARCRFTQVCRWRQAMYNRHVGCAKALAACVGVHVAARVHVSLSCS